MGRPTTLAAVVVTYNRSAKLARVLDALAAQSRRPDAIYVIDNASTDDTAQVLEARDDAGLQHIRLSENIGGAGGFHEGIKLAYKEGHDFLWVSDDDAYPEPDAIERLLSRLAEFESRTEWRPPFACSMVKWIDGDLCEMNIPQPVWDWPRFYAAETPYMLVGSCSFVSVLLPRWAIERHGLPIKDYFIWHDDVEYTMRLARSYPGLYVPESVVIHDTPENKGVNYGLVTEANLWKFKYGARNETSRRWRDQGAYGVAAFAYGVRGQLRAAAVPIGLRREIYKAMWRGLRFQPATEGPLGDGQDL